LFYPRTEVISFGIFSCVSSAAAFRSAVLLSAAEARRRLIRARR
jgi:hypothetical protein